jgi:TonB-linked SusC/RagA family outer membrane protein
LQVEPCYFFSMKRLIITVLILIPVICGGLFSQSRTITGTVKSAEDSLPLPGATIVVKGTEIGTVTNLDGFYTIDVPLSFDTLIFSFVGLQPQSVNVNGRQTIDITLSSGFYEVKEVVVTALGISRDSKALGYSATSVNNEEITRSRDRSLLNSLQGKVAGVDISSASGAPGSSTRILLRGLSSLAGSNQPLFIIDGVPVNNSFSGSTSINGGIDYGNKINDLNPEDIESVSVLKGASGAALYGSRAANGVIIITTKKGANEERKPEIAFTSSMGFEYPLRLVQYQNEFGQGLYGDVVAYENTSWGPAFDQKFHYWGNEIDNTLRVKSYTGLEKNVREFFTTGRNYNNAISVSSGNEQMTYYLSYSNIMQDGIFPTNSDSYSRHTISLRSTVKLSKRLATSISANYVKKNNRFVPTGQGEQSVYNQVMQTPRDISLLELEDIDSKWNNLDNYYSLYTVNPYFLLKKNGNRNNEDRFYGNFDLDYNITKHLTAKLRLGADLSHEQSKLWRAVIEPKGNNEFASIYEPGVVSESTSSIQQFNTDLLLTYSRKFGKFSVDLLAGHNLNERSSNSLYAAVSNLTIPDFYQLSNSSETPVADGSYGQRRLVGAYGSADIGYKSLWFVSVTMRNDWSSTLPKQHNSFFYPGISTSLVFTELFPGFKRIMPFGKIRAAYTRVGNDAGAYQINTVFVNAGHSDGYGSLRYPLPNGVNSYEVSNQIGNQQLKPELSTEYEVGTDMRFFSNRISIDFSYYNKVTTDLIWPAPLASSSGYSAKVINLGKITNKGIEALLNLTPVKYGDFQWDLTFNFSRNRNLLVELNDNLDRIVFTSLVVEGGQQIHYVGKPGKPIGIFEGRTVMRDDQGRIVVDNNGLPKAAEDLIEYGTREYDYIAGAGTRLSFKGLQLSVNFDIKQGGIMYSRTKDISVWAGTVPLTLYNNRQPFIIPNSVYEVDQDANGDPIYAENTIPINAVTLVDYWGNGGVGLDGNSLVDKSYVKLREAALTYDIPKSLLARVRIKGLELSVTGRNLLLWTPDDQTYIDPEQTTFGNDLVADFGEYGAQPTVRSVSFGLRLIF